MTEKERLYQSFGELIYVVAMADGIIQPAEIESLQTLMVDHEWSKEIEWSFNYERSKTPNVDDLYQKVINTCHQYGPSPIYAEFISAMKKIAEADQGTNKKEKKIIESFSSELIARFQRDLAL